MATPSKSKEIAFNGKLRTNVDGTSIGPNDFQVLKNLRYTDVNVRGVQGHTKINTVAAPETAVRNGFHFRKDQPSESHVLIDANLKCYDLTATVPGTGTFNTTPIYTDAAGVTFTGRYAVAPTGMLSRCNGKEALLWGGTEYGGISFIDNPSAGQVYDYTDSMRNTLSDSLNVASIHTVSATATFYVGSPMPIDAVKFYIVSGTGNSTSMWANYWQGSAWAPVASPSDGTNGLQTVGNNWFTFDSANNVSKQTQIEKTLAHWYQFNVSAAGDFNNICKLSHATVSIPMQPIQDLFDGEGRPCAAFILKAAGSADKDNTTNVYSSFFDSTDATTYSNIGFPGVGSSTNNIVFGFGERISGLMFYLSDNVNNSVGTISMLDYWNGSAWVSLLSSVKDGTLNAAGTITMAQNGWVTWTPPLENLEFSQTKLPGHQEITSSPQVDSKKITDEFSLYYYRLGFSAIAAATWVSQVKGIPAQKKITGYSFADQYAGRLMLCDNVDGARNSVRYSSYKTSNVFNGQDSDTLFFGGDEAVVATAALYNRYGSTETNTFVVCKKGETWVLSGDDPEKWIKFRVSNTIGCVAPLSMVAINLSPKESSQQVSFNAAVWVSSRGVEVFAGGSIQTVSDDISDLFDTSRSTYLGASLIASITAFYDTKMHEYHMIIPGISEFVWDTKRNKWFEISRGGPLLYGGFPVADTSGYQYCYGFNGQGNLMRLENGTDFDGTDISHTLRTGDFALPDGSIMEWAQIQWFILVAKAKTVTTADIQMTYYNDTATAVYGSTTISPTRSGYRLINTVVQNQDIQTTFHGFEFVTTTDNETTGFEPLYLGIRYTVFPRQLS